MSTSLELYRTFNYGKPDNFDERFDEWIAHVREHIDTGRELRDKYQEFLDAVNTDLKNRTFGRNKQLKKNMTKVRDTLEKVLGESYRRVHFHWGTPGYEEVEEYLTRRAAEYKAKHREEE